MTVTPQLQLDHVTVTYGRHVALDDVSCTFAPGTSTALVGGNGSGKTTMLHVLAGLLTPASGTVSPSGVEVAYVLQHIAERPWMPLTVDEVLRMGRFRKRWGVRRLGAEDRRALSEAAARLEVENLRRRQFGELSGGQRQRVLVAQALAQRAPVLLMDEPITGLDLPSQARILDIIEQETDAGRTVVITTHHLEEAHHCDQALVLAHRLVAAGPPLEVLTPDILRDAYQDQMFGAHAGHDHPVGLLLIDEHGHDDHSH